MEEKENKYGYLNQLSTEDFEEILRADIASSEDENEDMILYILEVIEKREKEHPTGRLCDVNQAWKEFQEHYMDLEEPLYPMSDFDDAQTPENDTVIDISTKTKPADKPNHRSHRAFLKWVLPIAAAVALLLVGMIAAQAAGIDVFGALAKWTDDTFRFVSPQSKNMEQIAGEEMDSNSQELHDAFQAALDECGITENLAPTWFPEGCVMDGEPVISLPGYANKISCKYQVGEQQHFIITIQQYEDEIVPDAATTEKDTGPVEQYLANGRLFYIMSNNGLVNAIWSDGQSFSLKVFGNISTQDLKQLLDLIGA